MFLSRNIHRIPCVSKICRTLVQDSSVSIKSPVLPPLASTQTKNEPADWVKFTPTQISFDLGYSNIRKKEIIDIPILPNKIIENPLTILNEIDEINRRIQDIRLPDVIKRNTEGGMQCQMKKDNRPLGIMIIRRKKMKKHKRRKLWKRMRFEWAKRRQRREFKKEKLFQADMVGQIKEAEKFSAEEYVEEKIRKATETILPRYYRGHRLPAFVIKDLIEKDRLKRERAKEKKERFEKYRHVKL